ncbi:MAG: 1,4-dihydroxy-2-naphthoyl-CoA hydrolase [Nonlabens sp.]|mgnify:FL=1|jgi:1,4-dihydroxy-2-naphthoyl-CoA hydrolase
MFIKGVTIEAVNKMCENTLVDHLGIEVIELGEDYLVAKMPVDQRTHQPMGLLHGGASVVLAETIGSIAASFTVNQKLQHCVGLEINANHIRSVSSGYVFGRTKSIHLGKRTQIWEINITNEEDKLVCISRLTMAVIDKKN